MLERRVMGRQKTPTRMSEEEKEEEEEEEEVTDQ